MGRVIVKFCIVRKNLSAWQQNWTYITHLLLVSLPTFSFCTPPSPCLTLGPPANFTVVCRNTTLRYWVLPLWTQFGGATIGCKICIRGRLSQSVNNPLGIAKSVDCSSLIRFRSPRIWMDFRRCASITDMVYTHTTKITTTKKEPCLYNKKKRPFCTVVPQ